MCDVVSLMYVKYDSVGNGQAYRKRWFKQYPILVEEDIYEFLLEEGFSQEEAMELTVFYKDHPEKKDDVKQFFCRYARDGDFKKIREPVLAAKMRDDFKKFIGMDAEE